MNATTVTKTWLIRLATLTFAVLVIHPKPGHAQQTSAAVTVAQGPTLSLSMQQAITMALETNLGLKSERLNVDVAAQDIVAARSAFLPILQSNWSRQTVESPSFKLADGTTVVPSSATMRANGTLGQALPWFGSNYSVSWSGQRLSSAGSNQTYNPLINSSLVLQFVQPLWRDFRIDPARGGLERTQRLHAIADIDLQQRIVATEANVKLAYLSLVAAIEGRKVAQKNMDVAEESLRNTRARVAVGQAPQIDISTTEASVESNRDQLLQAEARIQTQEDLVRSLVLDEARPDFWQLHIEPTDTIQLQPREIDEETAIKSALADRLDLIALKRSREITDLNLDLSHNATKPSVDFNLTYSASGTGGRQIALDGITNIGIGSILGDAFGGSYPSWTTAVSFSYPLGRSAAQAAVATTELTQKQQDLAIRQLELEIVRDVREAARSVRTSQQRVQATTAARLAAEKQLDAEERKNAVGLTDTFSLQQKQQVLAGALSAELNAMISYNTALITFQRVQKIR